MYYLRTMNVQAFCDRRVANDASLTELRIFLDNTNDSELKLILKAAKKNKTLKRVLVRGEGWPLLVQGSYRGKSLSVLAARSLASVVSEHPEIQEIEFYCKRFKEFGPIALAIQQNRNLLTRLLINDCRVTPNDVKCIRWLLTENALESITLKYHMLKAVVVWL